MTLSFLQRIISSRFVNPKVLLTVSILIMIAASSCKKSESVDQSKLQTPAERFKLAQEQYRKLTSEMAARKDYYNSLPAVQRDAVMDKDLARLRSLKEAMTMTQEVRASYRTSDDCMENYMYCSPQTMVIGYTESQSSMEAFLNSPVEWRVLTHVFNWWRVDSYETLKPGPNPGPVDEIVHNGSVLTGPASLITTWTENFVNGSVHATGLFASMMIGGYVTCGSINSGQYYATRSFIPK